MNEFFKECEIVEHKQADDFKHRFAVDLERIPQGINVVGDFFVLAASDFTRPLEIAIEDSLVGRRIEFKNDRASVKTGNLFLEFEQTLDGWHSKKISGSHKAILDDCILVVTSGTTCFVFNSNAYFRLIAHKTDVRTTRKRINGNTNGSFTRGMLIPLKFAVEEACFTYDMAEKSTLSAISF